MDGGGEGERLKAEKHHVDERNEEVIGEGKRHGFGDYAPKILVNTVMDKQWVSIAWLKPQKG